MSFRGFRVFVWGSDVFVLEGRREGVVRFCQMNPETERRLAAMIMEEANMMRQRAEKDGVGAYLAKPVVKARPNRQFLTAMVRGVQQGACFSLFPFLPFTSKLRL